MREREPSDLRAVRPEQRSLRSHDGLHAALHHHLEGGREVAGTLDGDDEQVDPELGRGRFQILHVEGMGLAGHPEDAQPRRGGDDLLEDLQALDEELAAEGRHSRDVAPRPGQARDEAELDRVPARGHDDGNRRGRLLGSECGLVGVGDDHVDLGVHQLRDEPREAGGLALRPARLERVRLTLHVSERRQALAQSREAPISILGAGREHADARDLRARLRGGRKRHGERSHARDRHGSARGPYRHAAPDGQRGR